MEKGWRWKERKSIAGSEYIQRRSAVRVWKFETAFHGRVLPPKSQRESARDGNLTGRGGEGWIGDGREKRRGCKGKDVRYIAGYFVSIISGEINSNSTTQSPVSIRILLEIFEEILRIEESY